MKKSIPIILVLLTASLAMAMEQLTKIPAGALQSATATLVAAGKSDMTLVGAYNTGNRIYDVGGAEVSVAFCPCSFTQLIFENEAGMLCSVTVDEAKRYFKVLAQSCVDPSSGGGTNK